MKKKTVLAALLLTLASVSHAEQQTQGKVEMMSFVCGDHFVQLHSVDHFIDKSIVDDVPALHTAIEHKAKAGVAVTNILILTSVKQEEKTAQGYELTVKRSAITLTPMMFTPNDSPNGFAMKATSKAVRCTE